MLPAMPAISLAGHAAAVHGEQMPILVVAIVALIQVVISKRAEVQR